VDLFLDGTLEVKIIEVEAVFVVGDFVVDVEEFADCEGVEDVVEEDP